MQRFLIAWLKRFSLRSLYAVTACVIPWFVLLSVRGRRAVWKYMRERQGFGFFRSCRMTFLNFYRFGQVILDRFAVYAGQRFTFRVEGDGEFRRCCDSGSGAVMLCAHVGNFEITGYSLQLDGHRINSLVFGGETETVMANRERSFAGNNVRMVPVSADMSHIFLLNNALAAGEIVTIHADRVFGSSKSAVHGFLGAPARFPLGPYVLAAGRDVPVFAAFTMKTAAGEYAVRLHRIDRGGLAETACGSGVREKAGVLLDAFVGELESVLREYPEQWFNYYDFWAEGRPMHLERRSE